jgi:peptidoglycan hydrolase CwlO-like protein
MKNHKRPTKMLSTIIALLSSSVITGLLTWMFTRRKVTAEAKGAELDNVEKAVAIWRELATDLNKKLETLSQKCDALTTEITQLRAENKSLKKQMEKFGKTIDSSTDH